MRKVTTIERNILDHIHTHGFVTTRDLVDKFDLSRAYVQRKLRDLVAVGVIERRGSTNQSRYFFAGQKESQHTVWKKTLKNRKEIDETHVLNLIRDETLIFSGLQKNITTIFEYAFTEMLNNAKEHSRGSKIKVDVERCIDNGKELIMFIVKDDGVGIFENIKTILKLASINEAIERLLKGKQTTMPEGHSGEGIFFTSRIADEFRIRSRKTVLTFDNDIQDVFVGEERAVKGTDVRFVISVNSKKDLIKLFDEYCTNTDEMSLFDKTHIYVKVYQTGGTCISRSQAKRVLTGLETFERITLDFSGVSLVGQGFADEVFRVYQQAHPKKQFQVINANEAVAFMVKRAGGRA
jgi:predicted transcriptional regulator